MKYTPVSEWKMKKEGLKRVVLLTRQITVLQLLLVNSTCLQGVITKCLLPVLFPPALKPGHNC